MRRLVRDLVPPPTGHGLSVRFQLHFGSRVQYDPATGHWWPPEDKLAVPEDLPVLQRMKVCLDQVTPLPPNVEVVQMVAAQCGVTPVKRRIRLPHSSSPEATSIST